MHRLKFNTLLARKPSNTLPTKTRSLCILHPPEKANSTGTPVLHNQSTSELCNLLKQNQTNPQTIIRILGQRQGGLEELLDHLNTNKWQVRSSILRPLISRLCTRGHTQKALDVLGHPAVLPEASTYDALIAGFCNRGNWREPLALIRHMQQLGIQPTLTTFSLLISASLTSGNVDVALKALYSMRDYGLLPDELSLTWLLSTLCKSRRFPYALKIFHELVSSGLAPGVDVYNTLINGCCKGGSMEAAMEIFTEMKACKCYGNDKTYGLLIHSYLHKMDVDHAYALYKEMKSVGLRPNASLARNLWRVAFKTRKGKRLWNADEKRGLVYMELYNGNVEMILECRPFKADLWEICVECIVRFLVHGMPLRALKVFETMRDAGWMVEEELCAMILDALSRTGKIAQVEDLFRKAKETNLAGQLVYSSYLISLLHTKRVGEVESVFSEMEAKGIDMAAKTFEELLFEFNKLGAYEEADLLSRRWGYKGSIRSHLHLIRVLCRTGPIDRAWDIYLDIQTKGHSLDRSTYRALFDGLCKFNLGDKAYDVYNDMVKRNILLDTKRMRRLMRVLCRACKINKAWEIFNRIEANNDDCVMSYGILIDGLIRSSSISEALKLVEKMKNKGHSPSLVVYNSVIRGLTSRGQFLKIDEVLEDMRSQGLEPDAFTFCSIIDGLCKANKCSPAIQKFKEMKRFGCQPDDATYTALILGLCKFGNPFEALQLFTEMKSEGLKPVDSIYKHLARCLESRGHRDKAKLLLEEMERSIAMTTS